MHVYGLFGYANYTLSLLFRFVRPRFKCIFTRATKTGRASTAVGGIGMKIRRNRSQANTRYSCTGRFARKGIGNKVSCQLNNAVHVNKNKRVSGTLRSRCNLCCAAPIF